MSWTLARLTAEEYDFWDSEFSERQFEVDRFKVAPLNVRRDRKVVMMAVSRDGLALKHVCRYMQEDRHVVSAAVTNNGLALKYAGPEIRNSRDIVIDAILQDYRALAYASWQLRNDPSFMRLAIQIDSRCEQYRFSSLSSPLSVPLRTPSMSPYRLPLRSSRRSPLSVPLRSRTSVWGSFWSRVVRWRQY